MDFSDRLSSFGRSQRSVCVPLGVWSCSNDHTARRETVTAVLVGIGLMAGNTHLGLDYILSRIASPSGEASRCCTTRSHRQNSVFSARCRRFGANLGFGIVQLGCAVRARLAFHTSPCRMPVPGLMRPGGTPGHKLRCARSATLASWAQLPCGCRACYRCHGRRRPVAVRLRCVAWTGWPSSRAISAAGASRRMRSWSGWLPLRGRLGAGGR